METTTKLISLTDEAKRRTLKFEGLGIVADFKDAKTGKYKFSEGATALKTYKIGYVEKTVEGYDRPFKNLSQVIEETLPQAAQGANQRDDGYWMNKDRTMTRLGCLRDAIAYLDIIQRAGQAKKIELKQVEALTNTFYEAVTSDKDPMVFDFDKHFLGEVKEEKV